MKRVGALLFGLGLMLAVIIVWPVLQTVPAAIRAVEHDAHIEFSAEDTTVLFDTGCLRVYWSVDNIRTVRVDGRSVIGTGARLSCAPAPTITITFQDGSSKTYTIEKQVRVADLIGRVLLIVCVLLLGLGVALSGLPILVGKKLRVTRWVRRLNAIFPRLTFASDRKQFSTILALAVACVLIGAVVRTHFLSRPLTYDESNTYLRYASRSLSTIISDYHEPNNHIFHTVLVSVSTSVFGLSVWALRLPAYFAGLLLIAATFAIGRRFYNWQTGLMAAALVAGSSWLIKFSVTARGYTLISLDFLLLLLVASSLRRRGSPSAWVLLALLGAIGIYTVPIMVYPLGIAYVWLGLSMILENQGRRRWLLVRDLVLNGVLTGLMAGLLYLPAYLYMKSAPAGQLNFGNTEPVTLTTFSSTFVAVAQNVRAVATRDLASWVVGLLIAGFLLGVLFHTKLACYRVSLVAATLLWLPVFLFLYITISYDRLWLFLLPPCLIVAAGGWVYAASFIGLRRAKSVPAVVWGIPVLVVALVGSFGVIQSKAVTQVETFVSDRSLGAEAAIEWLHDQSGHYEAIFCASHCPELQLYGLLHDVKVVQVSSGMSLPERSFYLIEVQQEAESTDLEPILQFMKVSPQQIEASSTVLHVDDTTIFQLVPARNR